MNCACTLPTMNARYLTWLRVSVKLEAWWYDSPKFLLKLMSGYATMLGMSVFALWLLSLSAESSEWRYITLRSLTNIAVKTITSYL